MKLHSPRAKATVVAIMAVVLALTMAVAASAAPPWPDAPNTWWIDNYGVTEAQVSTVADGYDNGLFGPNDPVTRGQFAKMALNGLDIDTLNPTMATFQDVPITHTFFRYIEGAYANGLIKGYPVADGMEFGPGNNISRQQANSILGRYLSGLEIEAIGAIHGIGGHNYASLEKWYAAKGSQHVNKFLDAGQVDREHQPATAYLIYHRVVQGSAGRLSPLSTLNRAQAAALVLRIKAAADSVTTPPDPNIPPSGDPLDAQAAVGVALAAVPGGAVIEVERETHHGQAVWEVVVRDPNGRGIELKIETTTGDILKRESENLPWYAKDSAPKIDIREAIAIALAATPGTIEETELDWEQGRLVWEVEILTANGRLVELDIDAVTGRIIH